MYIVGLDVDEGDRLRAIRIRAVRDTPEAFDLTEVELRALPSSAFENQLRSGHVLVAVDAGEDVGLIRGEKDDSGDPRVRWLMSMWVDPDHRGRGVGSALIEALLGWARRSGASWVKLEVGSHNRPARARYERSGFQFTGRRRRLSPPRSHIEELEFCRAVSPAAHDAQAYDEL